MKTLREKLSIYLQNNEEVIVKKVNDYLMLLISIVQTILIVAIARLIGHSYFDIIVGIIMLLIFIHVFYNINHYTVINCTIFTILTSISGISTYWFSPYVVGIIIIYINKATPKVRESLQRQGIDPLFFARRIDIGKSIHKQLIKLTSNR